MAKLMPDIDGVKVCIRSRPLLQREENQDLYWDLDSSEVKHLHNKEKPYYFNRVFNGQSTTSDVFKEIAMPIVNKAMEGFNGTIFAYGQTSSGKTHTMMGSEESPGIIPLSVNHIFDSIQATPDREFLLRVTYLEIYNESLNDLLNTEVIPLKIRENEFRSISITGLTEEVARSFNDVMTLVAKGHEHRSIAATNMNDKSSRSHAVFRIIIESRERSQDFAKDDETAVWVAQLNMVDLAGSERSSSAGTDGSRLIEGCYINKSLSNLCKVINQINSDNKFVSFRDSKLTRILQSSLGGNSLTAIICTITLAAEEETRSTLRFANSAMKVKNKPKFNEVLSDAAVLTQHKREIFQLKKKLSELEKEISKKHDEGGSDENLKKEFYEKIDYYKGMFLVSTLPSMESTNKKPFNRRMTWAPSAMKPAGSNESLHKPHKVVRSSENYCTAEQFLNVLNRTDPVDSDQRLKRPASKNSNQAKRMKTELNLSNLHEVSLTGENDQLKEQLKNEVERSTNFQSRVEQFEAKMKKKDGELEQIRKETSIQKTETDSKIQDLKREVADFKRRESPDVAGLRRSNDSLVAQLQDQCRETRKMQQQCDQYISRNSNLTQQLSDLTLEMSQVKDENDNKTSSSNDETNDTTIPTSSDEVARLNELLSDKNKLIKKLEAQMICVKNEHEDAMKEKEAKSLFGDVCDVSLYGLSPDASKTMSSPLVFGKKDSYAENGSLLKKKDEEIQKLKADLAEAEELLEFNENEKLIHLEDEKTSREEIKKLNDLIETHKEEFTTIKSELTKQGERFAETFNPENQEEKKKIEELMKIVKDYERNSNDAQFMYQETNKKVSQLTTDKHKLEDLTNFRQIRKIEEKTGISEKNKQKIEIDNLTSDVESYKAMVDITGMTTSNRMQRSICEPFDPQDENLPELYPPPAVGGGLSLEDEMRQADEKTIANLQDKLQLVEGELKDEKYRLDTILNQLENEKNSHRLVVDEFAQFRVEMETRVKPMVSDSNTSAVNFESSITTDVKAENEGEFERLKSELEVKEQQHLDKMQQTSNWLKTSQTKVEELELRIDEVLEEKQKCQAEAQQKISQLEAHIEEHGKDKSENRVKELATILELENRITQLAQEKYEYETKESKLQSQIEQLMQAENDQSRNESNGGDQKEMIIDGRLTLQERSGLMKRINELTAENDKLKKMETQANKAQLGDENLELETLRKLEQSEVKIQSTNEVWGMERDQNNKEIERLEILLSERQSALMKMSSEKDIAEHQVGKMQDQCKMLENEKSELESSLNAKNFGVGSGFFGGRQSGIMSGDRNYERLESKLKTQSFNLDLTKQRLAEVELSNKNLKNEQRKIDHEHYTAMKKLTDELQELRILQRKKDDEIESLKEDIKRIKMKYEREITETDQMVEAFRTEIQNLQGVCEKSSDIQKNQKEEIARLQEDSKAQLEQKLKISHSYDSMQKDVDRLRMESEVLTSESENLKAQNECLKVENKSINSEKESLKSENEGLNDENEIIKAEKEVLKTVNEDLKNEKENGRSDYENLTVEKESLRALNEDYKSDIQSMETQKHDLVIENEDLKTRNENYKNENESLKIENESINSEKESLKIDIETVKSENEGLKNETHSLNTANESLKVENDNYKAKNKTLETESNSLKAAFDDCKSENETLKIENQNLMNEKKDLKTENETLKIENQNLMTENKDLKTENETVKIENQNLMTENKDLKTENEIIMTEKEILTAENEDLNNEKGNGSFKDEAVKAENGCLETMNVNDEVDNMETQNLNTENEDLKSRNKDYKNENECLKSQNECLKVENENVISEKESLIIENETIKSEIEDLQNENESIKAEKEILESENEDLKTENGSSKNLTEENENLKILNENYKEEVESIGTQNQNLRTENEDLETQNECYKNENESLNIQNEYYKNENEDLKNKNQIIKAEKDIFEADFDDLTEENENLKILNENSKEEVKSIGTQNQNLRTENEDLKNENQSIKAEKEILETENEDLKNDISSKEGNLEGDHENLKAQNENYKTEVENIETQNLNLMMENEDLKTRNESYKNEKESLKQTYENEIQKCTSVAKAENETLKQQSDNLNTKHAQEKERLAEKHLEKEQVLMEEMHTLKENISAVQEEISRLKVERLEEAELFEDMEKCNDEMVAELDGLRTTLTDMEQRNDLLKQELEKRASELNSFLEENEKLKLAATQQTSSTAADDDDHSACKRREEELKDETDDLKLDARRRNAFIENLEEQNKDMQDDCSRLKGDLEEESAQLGELKVRYETLQRERDVLMKQQEDKVSDVIKNSEAQKLQVSELEAKLREAREEEEQLKATNSELQTKVNEADLCTDPDFHRRRMLLEDHSDLSETEKRFVLAYDSYNQEMEKNATCQREIEDLRAHIEDQQRIVDVARKSAEEAADTGNRVSEEVEQVRQRAEDAEKKLGDLRVEMEELIEQSTSLECELSEKRNKLQAAEEVKVETARQLTAMADDLKRLERERKTLSADYQQAKSQLSKAEEQCESLSRVGKEKKNHPIVDQRKLTELTDERDAAVEDKNAAEKKLEDFMKYAQSTISDNQVEMQEMNKDWQSSNITWREKETSLKTQIEAQKTTINELEDKLHKMNIELTQIRNEVRTYRSQYDTAHEERQSFVKQINTKDRECADLNRVLQHKQQEIENFDAKWKRHQKMTEEAVARSKEEIKSNCLKFQAQLLDYDRLKAEHKAKQEKLQAISKQLTESESKHQKFAEETKVELQTISKQLQQKEVEIEQLSGEIKELKAVPQPKRLQPSSYQREKEQKEVTMTGSTSSAAAPVRRSGRLSTTDKKMMEVEECRSKLNGRKKEYEEIFYDLEWRIPFFQECQKIAAFNQDVKAVCDRWSKHIETSGEISSKSRQQMIEKFTAPGKSEGIRTRSGTALVINTQMPCPTDNAQQQMLWLKLKSEELQGQIEFTIENSQTLLDIQNQNRRFRRELNAKISTTLRREDQDKINRMADRYMSEAKSTTFKFDKIRSKQPEPVKKAEVDNSQLGKSKCRPVSEEDNCKQM